MIGRPVVAVLCAALALARTAAADHPSGGGGGGDKPPAPGGADKPAAPSGGNDKPAAPSSADKAGSDDDHDGHEHADTVEAPVFSRGALVVAAHPLPIAMGFYGVGGDVALNGWLALGMVAQYYRRSGDASWSGAGAELGAQFFLVGSVFRGLYVAPRLTLHSIGSDDARAGGRRLVPGGAATIGMQWAAKIGFTVRAGIGVAVRRGRAEGDASSLTVPFDGAGLALDGAIGWVF